MAQPGDARDLALTFLGPLTASAAAHETTAALFERLTTYAQERGIPLPPGGAVAFNQLRSAAVALAVSSETLAKAPATAAIESRFLSAAPYQDQTLARPSVRTFDVRVPYHAVTGGVEGEGYVTLRYTGGLPATVGELRAEAEDVAASLVEGYGAHLTAVGDLEIAEL